MAVSEPMLHKMHLLWVLYPVLCILSCLASTSAESNPAGLTMGRVQQSHRSKSWEMTWQRDTGLFLRSENGRTRLVSVTTHILTSLSGTQGPSPSTFTLHYGIPDAILKLSKIFSTIFTSILKYRLTLAVRSLVPIHCNVKLSFFCPLLATPPA